jgi:hypothetical protein
MRLLHGRESYFQGHHASGAETAGRWGLRQRQLRHHLHVYMALSAHSEDGWRQQEHLRKTKSLTYRDRESESSHGSLASIKNHRERDMI